MIIRKIDNLYIIKIVKEKLNNFDFFNQEQIKELFKNIIIRLKKKYKISGLLDINVYTNDDYGMMIEIENVYSYFNEIDMHIHFHLDSIFLNEINENEFLNNKEIYYYQKKYYTPYNELNDSNIIYKTNEIIEKGIKIY